MARDAPPWPGPAGWFRVLRSPGGHLGVWPADRPLPGGWQPTGSGGDQAECLAVIEGADTGWTGPECADPAGCPHDTVHGIVAEAVRSHGERIAVSDPDRKLSYLDLDRQSGRLAAGLRQRGIRPGDRVAVHLPRGVDVFVALLGILKAGGAYVPIDTRQPPARRDLMIRDSAARLLVAASSAEPAPTGVATVDGLTAAGGEPVSGTDVAGCQAAAVLFTSGSSGSPKAIVLEHRNLVSFARNPTLPPLEPADRVAHVSSLSFDAFSFEAWCTLASGARVVVLPTMPDMIAGDLHGELRRHGITAMLAPTMALNHIVREDPETFAPLRILHTGGDVIVPAACRELLAGPFQGQFINLYGPTEGTTACTAYPVTAVGPDDVTVPIGDALSGARIYLLDADRRPVPDGEPGELFIGGAGVARGYLGQPGLTALRFLPDPFAGDGGRMYATGDRARRRPDGMLEFLGRLDGQVKVRGYRVEPQEVERVLSRYAGVREVAVVVSGEGDGKHLVALVTGDDLSSDALRGYAAETLPEYLVPTAVAVVPEIPANDHGKRDTRRLLEIAQAQLQQGSEATDPRTEMERYLATVWANLLGLPQVGVRDDFFALGGNSLLAFRLRRRISRDLRAPVDVHDVLTTTVLGDLAALLERRLPVTGAGRSG